MKNKNYKILTYFFKIFKKRKKYYTPIFYLKDYYYERFLHKCRNGHYYSNLINNKLKKINKINTIRNIQHLENKPLNKIVIKDILKQYGKPYYNVKCKGLLGIQILLYRQKIGNHKIRLEFHFFNNKLFYWVYNFPYANAQDKNEILQIIKQKYLGETLIDIDFKNNYLLDKNSNIIFIEKDIDFSIHYLCNTNTVWKDILNYIQINKLKQLNKSKKNRIMLYKKL